MSAAPYLPPAAAGSYEEMAWPPSTGSSTTCHLIGREDANRGPFQYVHLPSRMTSAPAIGLAPTPIAAIACELMLRHVRMTAKDVSVFDVISRAVKKLG